MAVIGITPSNRLTDYLESVRRAGGEPRVLSIDAPPTLDGLDGVLFTGGGDVDPAHYRDARHPNTSEPDAARDAFELALAKLALAKDTPLLAICRGLQVVNVAAGGTLIQDIPAQVNQALGHQVDSPSFAIAHEVWVTRGHGARARDAGRAGRRRSAAGQQPPSSGRRKDRATGSRSPPRRPMASSKRSSARRRASASRVQWHPENFWRTGEFRSLFEEFVKAAESHIKTDTTGG